MYLNDCRVCRESTLTFNEDLVLESAFSCYDAVVLGVLSKELLASLTAASQQLLK